MDAAILKRAQDWARAGGEESFQRRPEHQAEGSIRERVREPTTDDATSIRRALKNQRKENGGVEKEPNAACPPNTGQVAQSLPGDRPNGESDRGVKNKADRYAIVRLGQKGRVSGTDR